MDTPLSESDLLLICAVVDAMVLIPVFMYFCYPHKGFFLLARQHLRDDDNGLLTHEPVGDVAGAEVYPTTAPAAYITVLPVEIVDDRFSLTPPERTT